jgi:hypothetical protein
MMTQQTTNLKKYTEVRIAGTDSTWKIGNGLEGLVVITAENEPEDVAVLDVTTKVILLGANPSDATLGHAIRTAIELETCRAAGNTPATGQGDNVTMKSEGDAKPTAAEIAPPRKLERLGREPTKIVHNNLYGRESFAAYLKVSEKTFDRIRAAMGDNFPAPFQSPEIPVGRLLWEGRTLLAHVERLQFEAQSYADAREGAPHA